MTATPNVSVNDTRTPEEVIEDVRKFAEELRGYCSPYGVSADYADKLEDVLNGKR